MTRPPRPPNVTIDANLSALETLAPDQIPARIAQLGLPPAVAEEVLTLTTALQRELEADRRPPVIGALLEQMRSAAPEAYARIGKPLYLGFVKRRSDAPVR